MIWVSPTCLKEGTRVSLGSLLVSLVIFVVYFTTKDTKTTKEIAGYAIAARAAFICAKSESAW